MKFIGGIIIYFLAMALFFPLLFLDIDFWSQAYCSKMGLTPEKVSLIVAALRYMGMAAGDKMQVDPRYRSASPDQLQRTAQACFDLADEMEREGKRIISQ